MVVGWTDPEGSRPWLGALLLAYYDRDGRLVYAGRVGTGIKQGELQRLWRKLQPLAAYAPGNRGLWVKVKCLHDKIKGVEQPPP
jgi:ATP-dependent DNA ligase